MKMSAPQKETSNGFNMFQHLTFNFSTGLRKRPGGVFTPRRRRHPKVAQARPKEKTKVETTPKEPPPVATVLPERPWLNEELIQYVAAMPDPLPSWAEKSPGRFCLKARSIFCFLFLTFLTVLVSFLACFGYFLMGFALPNWPSGRFL